jgi:hypothetical protein
MGRTRDDPPEQKGGASFWRAPRRFRAETRRAPDPFYDPLPPTPRPVAADPSRGSGAPDGPGPAMIPSAVGTLAGWPPRRVQTCPVFSQVQVQTAAPGRFGAIWTKMAPLPPAPKVPFTRVRLSRNRHFLHRHARDLTQPPSRMQAASVPATSMPRLSPEGVKPLGIRMKFGQSMLNIHSTLHHKMTLRYQ